jgi:FkbM family methyltransferase
MSKGSMDATETVWALTRRYARPLLEACAGTQVTLAGCHVRVPGPLPIRLSVVAGNIRIQRLIDALAGPGATVVDVGANIGYNTVYAAQRVGPRGRVIAVEPAQDNLAVLYANVLGNDLRQVTVFPVAAGRTAGVQAFFLRGAVSAVNSLYPDSFYAAVTDTVQVSIAPLDDLVAGVPDLVKIDVEGAELEVLAGMPCILAAETVRLIVEWHPILQEAAGHAPDALPRTLLDRGFTLAAASHTQVTRLDAGGVAALMSELQRARRPVELVATRV